jgi:hypothetical protein
VVLSTAEVRALLERRARDLDARKRLYQWASTVEHNILGNTSGGKPAICFWYSVEGRSTLPDVAVQGLTSLVRVGRLHPKLYTFQDFENIPAGVEKMAASDVLLFAEFELLMRRGVKLPIISDLVRLRVLCNTRSSYAWFWDVDTLVLVDLRNLGGKPDAFAHILASMDKPRSKGGTTTAEYEKLQINDFLSTPRDKACLLFGSYVAFLCCI